MKVAVISDIHGNAISFKKVIEDINSFQIDTIICCGDLTAFGIMPMEIVQYLECLDNAHIIAGNTDRWIKLILDGEKEFREKVVYKVEPSLAWTIKKLGRYARQYIEKYPSYREVKMENKKIAIVHGSLQSDVEGIMESHDFTTLFPVLKEKGIDCLVCGHTHIPFIKEDGETIIVNCGSVSLPYDGIPKPSWALLEINEGEKVHAEIMRTAYDRVEYVDKLMRSDMPMKRIFAERIMKAKM